MLSVLAFVALAAQEPLFNGRNLDGWTLGDGRPAGGRGWAVEDGTIATTTIASGRSDLLCDRLVRNFELTFEFKLSEHANTGVKYFVQHMLRYLAPGSTLDGSYGAVGLEFQLMDDASPESRLPYMKLGGLYGLVPPASPVPYRIGEWASARLRCEKGRCEHWINGRQVVAFDLESPEMKRKLKEAATDPDHSVISAAAAQVASRRGSAVPQTRIALQHHDSKAWFRSLMLKALP